MNFRFTDYLTGAVFLLLFFGHSTTSHSQSYHTVDSVNHAFMPALAYNSDFGFMGGGLMNRYHYKTDIKPFYSYTILSAILSTKGMALGKIFIDKPQAFGKNIRITTNLSLSRFLEDTYYGIGAYHKLPDEPGINSSYYLFKSLGIRFENIIRFPLHHYSATNQIDIMALANFMYETPWDNKDERLISIDKPLGFTKSRSFSIGTGLIWENRDSEFRPTKGNYLFSSFEIAQTWFGSSYNHFIFKYNMSHYSTFHVFKDITFASRFSFSSTSGDVPYWRLAYAGDEETLRGYPYHRFLDDNLILLNNELRTWLIKFKPLNAEFGGNLFFDIGRTFPNGVSAESVYNDLKYTFGFSGVASFFTPDFILRMDVGFSEEDMGIYFTAGYMF